MAGIGFTFRRLNPHLSFGGLIRVYGAAGIISSGPWLLSILGILVIGILSVDRVRDPREVAQFQVTVTYLFASSLIFTGALQLLFTRFIADRIFEKKESWIRPNLFGSLILITGSSGIVGALVAGFGFSGEPLFYRISLAACFVLMCDTWIVVVLLTGLKAYRLVLLVFVAGYGITVLAALALRGYGLEGLLLGFVLGQAVLFFALFALLTREHDSDRFVAFEYLRRDQIHPSLALTGLFYNLAIWADKLIFWFDPSTSEQVIGPLRASLVYDVPIFLAYLTITPGMAVFLVRMETDFAELYDVFYSGVREGATLAKIERTRDDMIVVVRQGIYEIFKIQGLALVLVFLAGPTLLRLIGIPELYLRLFYIDATAVGAQVLLLAILNVLFYLDQRKLCLWLCLLFLVSNTIFTLITHELGPIYYGYGFAIAVGMTAILGMSALSRRLDDLVSETFMLQSVAGDD